MAETFLRVPQTLLSFLQQRRDDFLREFRADKAFRIGLNAKYRALSPALWPDVIASRSHEDVHENTSGSENLFFEILDHLAAETINWNADVRAIFLSDLIHMQVNRMFSEQQREHELVIYFFLHKYQESKIARSVEFHT